MKPSSSRRIGLAFAATVLTASTPTLLSASTNPIPPAGVSVDLVFTGSPEDFVIPTANPPAALRLTVKGANGGNANPNDNHCEAEGGRGAYIAADFTVGYGAGELEPGVP